MSKKLVLFSGGLDSSVLLAKVVKEFSAENVIALNIYYGQKHQKEEECASKQAVNYGVNLINQSLSAVFMFDAKCPLLEGSSEEMPLQSYAEQLEAMGGSGTVKTYVPFRNGLFLSYATALALQLDCDTVYYGAHADDATGNAYPDCTEEFINSMRKAIHTGTGKIVDLIAPFWKKNKSEIVAEGIELNIPFEHTWSCYVGREKPCGFCGTCIDRMAAFSNNDMKDPLEYEGANELSEYGNNSQCDCDNSEVCNTCDNEE
jgi:7-cyano-7-deazaguanine synthase